MGHGHAHGDRSARNKRSLTIVLAMTTIYLLAEVIGGLVTHSLALLADAGHMLTDVVGVGLALAAIKLAEKRASPEKTYGYYRVEILVAAVNAVVLIGISMFVLYEAYERFRNPPQVESKGMLAVAAVGLVVNLISARVLQVGSKDSLNMKGAYFEVVSDMLTSVAVIVAGVIIWTTGWQYADPLLSAGIGLFILPRTWILLKEAVDVLLEGTPTDVNIASIREALAGLSGVGEVHDLHVWSLTSGMNAMSVHVVLTEGAEHDDVLRRAHERLADGFAVSHITVQVEPAGFEERGCHF